VISQEQAKAISCRSRGDFSAPKNTLVGEEDTKGLLENK
jgi:hypothetical protein